MFSVLIVFLPPLMLCTLTLDEELELRIDSSQFEGKDFESSMTVNGVGYTTVCDCTEPKIADEQEIHCAPNTVTLTLERPGDGASIEELQEELSAASFSYVDITRSSFRCLDGRVTEGMLGTPGGDFGEFAAALLVYQDMTERVLDKDAIQLAFYEYLECMEQEVFYWCSDDAALNSVEKEIGVEGVNLVNPKDSLKDALLQLLVQPDGVGDLHLKNMLSYPELYSIKPTALELFIEVFYQTLWDETNALSALLYLEVLPKEHNETAFLDIRTYEECSVLQVAPLIVPRNGNSDNLSLFVNHLDAVNVKRAQLSGFFAEKVARSQDGISPERFLGRLKHHGLNFLDVTGSLIAHDLPFYSASFQHN